MAASAPIQVFLGFFNQQSAQYTFQATCCFPNIIIVESIDSPERGTNPTAMTNINPCKENGPAGDQTTTPCSQVLNATDRSAMGAWPQNKIHVTN